MTVGELKEFLSHRDDDERVLVITMDRRDHPYSLTPLGDDLHGITWLKLKERE